MKTAGDNAETLINKYTRLMNNARQAEITQELSEIVGGADASPRRSLTLQHRNRLLFQTFYR